MIEVKNLTKVYGDKRGVNDVSFSIGKGEIVGLLGSNGAGKSTIMNMLAGYFPPTSGQITVSGCDVVANPSKAGEKIGFLPEIPPLYVEMSVERYLTFLAEIRNVSKASRKQHVADTMKLANVEQVKERLIRNLSKGFRQRVGLAQALIGNPEVLILDEPTVGLDPRQIKEVRNLIVKLKDKHTIILSSHILSEIKNTCERVIIINQGHMLADDTIENMEKGDKNRFSITIKGEAEKAEAVLQNLPQIEAVLQKDTSEQDCCSFELTVKDSDRGNITLGLAQQNMAVIELRPLVRTLEETFMMLTSQDNQKLESSITEEA
ncbi:MAG: ABC transporter ATP-binding protein [Christensenellaceae bacterium]